MKYTNPLQLTLKDSFMNSCQTFKLYVYILPSSNPTADCLGFRITPDWTLYFKGTRQSKHYVDNSFFYFCKCKNMFDVIYKQMLLNQYNCHYITTGINHRSIK